MTQQSEIEHRSPILVFLTKRAADVVISQLEKHGYTAVAVYTVPALFDALRSGTYTLAVTTRPGIATVRNIKLIPVLNLEVFFYDGHIDQTDSTAWPRRFDGNAFMERLRILNVPRLTRGFSKYDNPSSEHRRKVGLFSTLLNASISFYNNRLPAMRVVKNERR
ncbi:hypothetical protein LAV84_27425 [Rhizobium sp. VS19-DR104.2]|uniref:hypothetical protein n=1 Tax=unclassified Rhizobium TaxID=2613769 RepID=UPI001C5B12A3|nr:MULTISPECIES: hypothetical protein [unclassified Rhizobium]MBZ5763263.1 hypothetical protein [Rhizobium sp. VS19-DR96]MBZ5769368.1 hypothetical protein [Rhizobium sp. VS19-DR129.2]MBZ5776926.1 hypothetical protein [Rhizobium sp. VS19-DRK62.2]MBZ5787866.1 hypothetical protein [Rhizobium sp. VS19-DR121]MBZ5805321.1 hypothetical protein [Rhizobium sp. VS19-DR181]